MSPARRIARTIAAVAMRDLIPYGLASIVGALIVVTGVLVREAYQGRAFGFDNLVIAVFYGSLATFVFALPASAVFIAVGEWRKFGTRYHVAAGTLAATLSFLAIMGDAFVNRRRGDTVPFLTPEDQIILLFVVLGGAIAGLIFLQARLMLVRALGDLAFPRSTGR